MKIEFAEVCATRCKYKGRMEANYLYTTYCKNCPLLKLAAEEFTRENVNEL